MIVRAVLCRYAALGNHLFRQANKAERHVGQVVSEQPYLPGLNITDLRKRCDPWPAGTLPLFCHLTLCHSAFPTLLKRGGNATVALIHRTKWPVLPPGIISLQIYRNRQCFYAEYTTTLYPIYKLFKRFDNTV